MATDVFGDLREWGDVLTLLEQLRAAGELDDHQDGLARLLRYQDNWRLREEALLSAAKVNSPCEALVAATFRRLTDEQESLENRILAARALSAMLTACAANGGGPVDVKETLARMQSVMSDGGPPVLQAAVRTACSQVSCLIS
jgi:hypothetical protein